MPSKKPQVKVRLSYDTKAAMQLLCDLYEFTPSALVAHLIRTASRREKITTKTSAAA